jgi:YVTN family beta-propeller protein
MRGARNDDAGHAPESHPERRIPWRRSLAAPVVASSTLAAGAAPPAYVPQTSGLDGDRDRHHDRRGRGRDRDRQKAARLCRHDLRRAATWSTAITPDGRQLYAACGPSGAVSVIDTDSNTRMGDVTVGKLPWGVATGADARPPSASRDAVD